MKTNTDGEEKIESETEEDHAFIDNEKVEEEGPSFYGALEQERADQSDGNQPRVNTPKPEKETVKPLKKLRDRLEEYLKVFPVIGFNWKIRLECS